MLLYESKLTNDELTRYSRQIILPQIGVDGQIKIRDARILVIGLGGLGSPVCQYLASFGIGTLGILDFDIVEKHNLNRQIIHTENEINNSKSKSAEKYLKQINSSIKIIIYEDKFNKENGEEIIKNYDIILDCTDDIKTRYLVNDLCVIFGKKFVAASVLKWEGQVFTFKINEHCYRCMFPELKEIVLNCDEAGVVGSVCGIIGSIQATEAIKTLLGINEPKIIAYNALTNEFDSFEVKNKKRCAVCVDKKFIIEHKKEENKTEKIDNINFISWEKYLKNTEKYELIDLRDQKLFEMCRIKNSKNMTAAEIMQNVRIVKTIHKEIVLLCKKGITAIKIAKFLKDNKIPCLVLEGGLKSFKEKVDPLFPS